LHLRKISLDKTAKAPIIRGKITEKTVVYSIYNAGILARMTAALSVTAVILLVILSVLP
jgi:hypothetical protein